MYKFCPNCGFDLGGRFDTFRCNSCKKSFYANSKPTATIIPIYKGEVLLGVRGKDPQKGKLDFIGGFLDYGEDPLAGAVREFEEETGVMIDKKDLTFFDIYMDSYEFEGVVYQLLNVIYILHVKEKLPVVAADDVESLVWLPITPSLDLAFKHQNLIIEQLCKSETR